MVNYFNKIRAQKVIQKKSKKSPSYSSDSSAISDPENEDPSEYCVGGYHPAKVGDILNAKYQLVKKLGWGNFSIVWLASLLPSQSNHSKLNEMTEVAIKIIKSESKYTEAALDEIKILTSVFDRAAKLDIHSSELPIVRLLDSFDIKGPHGRHVCMVFEPLGRNLLEVIQATNHKGLPLPLVKRIAKQVLTGLDFLHRHCQIIHTDLKPENIMLGLSTCDADSMLAEHSNLNVKIVDLGSACWTYKHFTRDIQTRQYRSPEVILGCDYSEKVDIWSLGCIVFELLTGDLLFRPAASYYSKEEDHVAQIIELLGPIPTHMINSGKFSWSIFHDRKELKNIPNKKLRPKSLFDVLYKDYSFNERDAIEIDAFLQPILSRDPSERCSAQEALASSFLNE